jgi:RNA polymerase sigma-70 factor (ECF subfamily)
MREVRHSGAAAQPAADGPGAGAAARQQTVQEAVAAFRSGTDPQAAFRFLVETYYRPVESFFARRVASPEDRLDLTQETFLRIYSNLGRFRGESRFSTWLFRIAYNSYLAWARQRRLRVETSLGANLEVGAAAEEVGLEARPPASPAASSEEALLGREQRRVLREAIGRLPEQMRRCMVLRVVHELSYKEIAVAMRLSIETVKVHLFQGRRRLQEDLGNAFDRIEV